MPADNHVLKYGDLTAKGRAGGLAGEKVDAAPTEDSREATDRQNERKCIMIRIERGMQGTSSFMYVIISDCFEE